MKIKPVVVPFMLGHSRHPILSTLLRVALIVVALGVPSFTMAQSALPVSVKAHGSKGDGVTDDTASIESTVLEAAKGNGVIFFPPGEYLISRTIYLQSGMTVRGAQGAILKRSAAVTQKLTQPVKKGDTVAYVEDVKGYQVNQGFVLVGGVESGDQGLMGKIVAIDANQKKITIEVGDSIGGDKEFAADGKSAFSSAFPMLATNPAKVAISSLVIEGMTFDSPAQPGEPQAFFLAPIYIGAPTKENNQSNVTVRQNIVRNSASVGISVQVGEGVTIEGNQIDKCALAAIHVGATTANVTIRNNIIEDGEGMAVFLGKSGTIITNNFFKNYSVGCGGMGEFGSNSVISFNVFEGMKTGIDLKKNTTGRTVITDNLFFKSRGTDILLDTWNFCVVANNMFADGTVSGLSVRGSKHVSVTNNQFFNYTGDFCILLQGSPSDAQTMTQLSRIAGNIVVGGRQASLSLENSSQIIVSENQFLPYEGGVAIKIADTASKIQLTDNIVEGEIMNLSEPKK